MAKFNVGDKVRILDVDEIMFGDECFDDGDITEVVGFYLGNEDRPELKTTKGSDVSLYIDLEREGYAIEKVKDSEEKEFDIVALFDRVSKLEAKVAELEGGELSPSEVDYVRTLAARKTPNARRKEAIAKAKEFVAKIQTDSDNGLHKSGGNRTYNLRTTYSKFEVNEEKRTVVALVFGSYTDKLRERGIAKCNPDDVFNEHIGKAIALGRAYGLDVSEFENAPQPDEVAVGMKVEVKGSRFPYVDTVTDQFEHYYHSLSNLIECPSDLIRIISDTEAKY